MKRKIAPPHSKSLAIAAFVAYALIFNAENTMAQSGQKFSTEGNNLTAISIFGSLNQYPINFVTAGTQKMCLTTAGNLGLGVINPVYKFDVSGSAHYSGNVYADSSITAMNLYAIQKVTTDALQVNNNAELAGLAVFGNKITIDGSNSSISSNTGTLDFQNTNLTTTGDLNASNLNLTSLQSTGKTLLQADPAGKIIPFAFPDNSDVVLYGNGQWGSLPQKSPWIADSIGIYPDSMLANTNVFVKSLFASRSVSIGTFRFKNGLPGERDTISAEKGITITSPSKIEFNADTLTMKKSVGIGVASPQSALDVAGDINTSGTVYANNLYAKNSIAIGTLKISNGAELPPGTGKDTISTPYKLALVSAGREISLISDTVKVGDYSSTVRFDVNGSVRVRDVLWVETGLIVGKKFEGDKADVDTIAAKKVAAENVVAQTAEAQRIYADSAISAISKSDSAFTFKLGVAGDAKIKGNAEITGNLKVNGTLTGIANYDSLHIVNKLKIGNSIIALVDPNSAIPNHIYTSAGSGSLYIQSQNYDQNTIMNRDNGCVGIGGSTIYYNELFPSAKLDIRGKALEPFGTIAKPVMRITEESAMYPPPGSHAASANIFEVRKIVTAVPPINKFKYSLVVADTGNVGIGIEDPLQQFHVEGISYFNGDVGIGTFLPKQKLHVYGNVLLTGYNSSLLFGNGEESDWGNWGIEYENDKGGLNFWMPSGSVGCIEAEEGVINYCMFLKNDGNVGIANSDPQAKLDIYSGGESALIVRNGVTEDDVQFYVKADGYVIARDVLVKTGKIFPDYVFDKDYSLLSLSELEKYIQKNKHLPDVPSASDIKKDGLNLVDMDAAILKKVEEQSLYIIDLQKQIIEMQKEIDLLKKK